MRGLRIAQAMLSALRDPALHTEGLFDVSCVVYDPDDADKKVEPFYFDARRAPNAHSRDVGFSPNDLDMTTTAFPAVEALCLIGLQRFRPRPTERRRVFDYRTWATPLAISVAAPVASGAVAIRGVHTYRFECWFRAGQKKLKAFRPAVPVV
jgi:CRISPR-associated protein Csb3